MIGTKLHPLRIAIIGSGPSGFYAAEELLSQNKLHVEIDMFDRLPTPFGLVRGGVAPDHQKIKNVTQVYEKTASRNGFRFFGNVEFGKEIFLEDLRRCYHSAIFAVGSKSDRRMNIPGEDLEGSYSATEFVGWYNGHPDYQDFSFNLSCQRVAVVGNGNVAMDVTRILASDPERLKTTDITEQALEELRKSKIKEIFLLGRRGVAQASFTNPEIRELCHLQGADLVVDPSEVELDDFSKEDLTLRLGSAGITAKNNVQILIEQSKLGTGNQSRKIILKFLVSPVEICGKDGVVTGVKIEKNSLFRDPNGFLRPRGKKEYELLPVALVLRSVGYYGVSLPDLPYDKQNGTIPNDSGRIIDPQTKKPIPNLYVVGWAKRGPSGVIGTNRPDSAKTVEKVLEDVQGRKESNLSQMSPELILNLLKEKQVQYVSYSDWKMLDELEIQNGMSKGKVREKFTSIPQMLFNLSR